MELYEAIKKRRSYYKDDEIPYNVLAKILLAAHLAHSVCFSQPWNFVIIKDIEKRKKIKELVEKEREHFRSLLDDERKKIFDRIKIEAILDTPINLAVANCFR
jgi:5,6-dimethylbenzimidazole synthase